MTDEFCFKLGHLLGSVHRYHELVISGLDPDAIDAAGDQLANLAKDLSKKFYALPNQEPKAVRTVIDQVCAKCGAVLPVPTFREPTPPCDHCGAPNG